MTRRILLLSVIGMMAAAIVAPTVQAQPGIFPRLGSSSGASWLANGTYSIGWPDTTGVKILNTGVATFSTSVASPIIYPTQIAGGVNPVITGVRASVMSGTNNAATGDSSWVGGGGYNLALGTSSVVVGGTSNTAGGTGAFVGAGLNNRTSNPQAVVVGGISNVSSGNQSVVVGGGGNTAGDTYVVVVGGSSNSAATNTHYSFIGGGVSNTMGAGTGAVTYGVITGGWFNRTNAKYNFIGGGVRDTVSADYGFIPGGAYGEVTHYGGFAHSSGAFTGTARLKGTAQLMELVMRDTTSNAIPDTLTLDGADVVGNKYAVIDTGATWAYTIQVSARSQGGSSAAYMITGAIENVAGTVAMIGTPTITVLGEDDSSWDATVAADDGNNALAIIVTGAAGAYIRWSANCRIQQTRW